MSQLSTLRDRSQVREQAHVEFLSLVSHELRTPLNAVLGMASLLADCDLGAEPRSYLATLQHSAERLHLVLRNLTDFASLSQEDLHVRSLPFSLDHALRDVLKKGNALARSQGSELILRPRGQVPKNVMGDPDWLRQTLLHLVDNALGWCPGAEVELGVQAEEMTRGALRLRFWVQGEGEPLEEAKLKELFKRRQADPRASVSSDEWANVSLALAQRLVLMLGGTIHAENDGRPGRGTRIAVTLDTPPLRDRRDSSSSMTVMPLLGRSALILAPDPETLGETHAMVQQWGVTAMDGTSALEAATHFAGDSSPDMILVAESAGGEPAHHRLEQLKQMVSAELPPALLISDRPGASVNPGEEGFVDVIPTPVDRAKLYRAMTRIVIKASEDGDSEAAPRRPLPDKPNPDFAAARPLRLLLAEDDMLNQQLARMMLAKLGFEVEVVADGAEALEAVKRERYDAVLMDIRMPNMDGLEASRRINREVGEADRPLLVAVTAGAMEQDQRRCAEAGMDLYLSKPFKVDELMRVLDRCHYLRGGTLPAPDEGAAERGAGGSSTLDLSILGQLQSYLGPADGGEDDGVARLLRLYLDMAPGQIDDMEAAFKEGDLERVGRTAHSLKSGSSNMGAVELAELCLQLELQAGEGSDLENLSRSLESTRQAWGRLEQAINAELERRTPPA